MPPARLDQLNRGASAHHLDALERRTRWRMLNDVDMLTELRPGHAITGR
jgi:hypothetical protein